MCFRKLGVHSQKIFFTQNVFQYIGKHLNFSSRPFFRHFFILVARSGIFKKRCEKIYPKRAIGLNPFSKKTGDNYFFTMAQINEETCFECSQRQKKQNKIDVGPRMHKKWPPSIFFYIFFSYLLHNFSNICCTILLNSSLERSRHSGHFEPKNGCIRLLLKKIWTN